MIKIRKRNERGHFDHGWLDTYHSFSFADYYDPDHLGFRTLRVINEDRVKSGEGFGTHSHRDMEIITTILEGSLEHKDSMGNTSVIRPGEVQRMSAGTGVTHSEFNPSDKEIVHLLQIWILPNQKNLPPSYEQKTFDSEGKKNKLRLIVSPSGEKGSIKIHQDTFIYETSLEPGKQITHALKQGRGLWVQVTQGKLEINSDHLEEGDGAAIENQTSIEVRTNEGAGFLLFDLA